MANPEFRPFTAYIVEAVRTAGGKKNGRLSGYHPADLCAAVVDGLLEKAGVDGKHVEDLIVGCVCQVGAQAGNIGRNAVLSSKRLPESVPGTTVDRQCGSGQQALHFACQAVMSGTQDCVIAAGVESMSMVPIGANAIDGFKAGHGLPLGEKALEVRLLLGRVVAGACRSGADLASGVARAAGLAELGANSIGRQILQDSSPYALWQTLQCWVSVLENVAGPQESGR
mmetsp:Transcript_144906/g.463099  ORF Transcript_144906/g.463099 Transcript_144906/m.463099 type:complete len:227 (-) Transcript_144906:128-808(-)